MTRVDFAFQIGGLTMIMVGLGLGLIGYLRLGPATITGFTGTISPVEMSFLCPTMSPLKFWASSMQKRRTLWGALGQPSEKASVTTVSSGSLAINALTYSGCAPASVAAMKRVPTLTPEAPAAKTAARARPEPIPPAASTGTLTESKT